MCAALDSDGRALSFASKELREDQEFVLKALADSYNATFPNGMPVIAATLCGDIGFMRKATLVDRTAHHFVSQSLQRYQTASQLILHGIKPSKIIHILSGGDNFKFSRVFPPESFKL